MIKAETRKVFVILRYGRRKTFLTFGAACAAVEREIILKKHPSESPYEGDHGYGQTDGYYWRADMPRADILLRRMTKIVMRAYRSQV